MAARGVLPGTKKPPGSGRKVGSKNKFQIWDDTREDVLQVYKKMGGRAWLLRWSMANEESFVRLVLPRILPPMPAEPKEPEVFNPVINVNQLSDFEIARSIAFVLAKGIASLPDRPDLISDWGKQPEEQKQPEEIVEPPKPQEPLPPLEFPLAELKDNVVVVDTTGCDLSNYPGGSAEQGVPIRRKNLI